MTNMYQGALQELGLVFENIDDGVNSTIDLIVRSQRIVVFAGGREKLQTMADDQGENRSLVLPMGSLYEGALFILFEVIVLKLIDKLNINAEFMQSNHTNMERIAYDK